MLTIARPLTADGTWPPRYELLDGLRGLAALGVVIAHLGAADIGHFAVMVFFVISGYCITASARACQTRNVSFAGFMARRVRRIYPPYLLAIVFFVATRLVKIYLGGENDLDRPWIEWLQNLTLTQWLSVPFAPIGWPSDNPVLLVSAFWSLNYEEQFYAVLGMAMLLTTRTGWPLAAPVMVLAVIGFAWNIRWPDGWITGLFIEYFAHFALGSLLYFVLCENRSPRITLAFASALVLIASVTTTQIVSVSGAAPRAVGELAALSAFTLLLLLLRPLSTAISRQSGWRPVAALGTISYSLYLIHQFNLTLISTAVNATQIPTLLRLPMMLVLMIGLASVFWYCCERPFLNNGSGRERMR